jgi:hypothetical protein
MRRCALFEYMLSIANVAYSCLQTVQQGQCRLCSCPISESVSEHLMCGKQLQGAFSIVCSLEAAAAILNDSIYACWQSTDAGTSLLLLCQRLAAAHTSAPRTALSYFCSTHLPLLQLLVQLLLQVDDVQPRCWSAGHILHPELPILCPFSATCKVGQISWALLVCSL